VYEPIRQASARHRPRAVSEPCRNKKKAPEHGPQGQIRVRCLVFSFGRAIVRGRDAVVNIRAAILVLLLLILVVVIINTPDYIPK
jgi:hypothetical protein